MNKKGAIFIGLTTLIFSTMEIALKFISETYNPIQLNFLRFLIGGLVLLPFALHGLKEKNIRLQTKDLLPFIMTGFIGITVSMSLYQFAVCYTEASTVAILLSSNPLFVMILAYLILRDPIEKRNVFALALDIVGIIVIAAPWKHSLNLLGNLLTIAATVTFALYGVFGSKYSKKYGGIVTTCFSSLSGSIILILLALLTNIPTIGNALFLGGAEIFAYVPLFSGFTLDSLPYLLYAGIIVTGIGYACYFKAMEVTNANAASLVFFFKPLLAPTLAFFILHEAPTLERVIGMILILTGALVSILPQLLAHRKERSSQN